MTRTMIAVFFSMALGSSFAQPAKTVPDYNCFTGVPMFRGNIKLSEAETEAAYEVCKTQRQQERAKEDEMMRSNAHLLDSLEKAAEQSAAKVKQNKHQLCQLRSRYKDDGTDLSWCENDPPRLDVLEEAHDACRQYPDLSMCAHLIPLSKGKKVSVLKIYHEPGLFTEYADAKVTLQGSEGIWNSDFSGGTFTRAEFTEFDEKQPHTITIAPKNPGDMTIVFPIPEGLSVSKLYMRRTFCNTIFSGYSLYFPGDLNVIRPQGWNQKDCY